MSQTSGRAATAEDVAPSAEDLRRVFEMSYGPSPGWGPRQRMRFGYWPPNDYYAAVLSKLVEEGCSWADVGCGRRILGRRDELAKMLATRAGYVLGIDPDDNIADNELITEAYQGPVEACPTKRTFDLVTLNMVAEHIADPQKAINRIASLTKPDGLVLLFTPNKWSPMSIFAKLTPLWVHHYFKRILWNTEERDTFPVQYKLNTRMDLARHFEGAGFKEVFFRYLDDCRTFNKFRVLNFVELVIWRALKLFAITHPENCLLAVYRKS